MVCIGMPSLCLEKVIIAAAHTPQSPVDGNADLTAMDTLSPGDFRLLDTGNVVGVNTGKFMELRVLRYFLAVARMKNITRAAEELHITDRKASCRERV